MNNNSLPVSGEKAFVSINKSMIEGDIVNGTLNVMQGMSSKGAQPSTGMSFSDQSDFLKNWYSLDAGNVANFKA